MARMAETPVEQRFVSLRAIEAARAHPAGLAPCCFSVDAPDLCGAPLAMQPEPFHRAWLDAALAERTVLLIAARGHGKSEYYSAVLPAWLIGTTPTLRCVHVTSTDALAAMYSRRLQAVIESPLYRQIFPAVPGRGRKWTEAEWALDLPGQRDPTWRCAGRGSSITGGRADVLIVDDVVTLETARTPGERAHTLEWFRQTLLPMLVPETGRLLIIGTRYHEEDLYATLMAGGMPAQIYPAEDAAGHILWPKRFTRAALQARRHPPLGSAASYAAQYLCTPQHPAGEVFRRGWFPLLTGEPPSLEEVWWAWDTAVGVTTTADYSAGLLGGRGADGLVYVLAVARGRWAPSTAKMQVIAAWDRARAHWGSRLRGALVEDTKEGRVLQAWLRESAAHIPVVLVSPGGQDKATRAALIAPYCEAGRVLLCPGVDGTGWTDDLLSELAAFTPDGRHTHDDQVDALVYLTARLLGLTPRAHAPGRIVTPGRRR